MKENLILGLIGLLSCTIYMIDTDNQKTRNAALFNDRPIAINDTISVNQGESIDIFVLANDSDPDGDVLTAKDFQAPMHGTTEIPDGTYITYIADADYVGEDRFQYGACELVFPNKCSGAWVIINVIEVNDPPEGMDDIIQTDEEVAIDISPTSNDTDPEMDPLVYSIVTGPTTGDLEVIDNVITYTPQLNFNGTDSIQYEVCDPEPLCDRAWIRIIVNPANDPPESMKDSVALNEDTLAAVLLPLVNDEDIDDDKLTIGTIHSTTTINATISISGDTAIIYTPPPNYFGIDTLLYEVCDANICVTDTITVNIISVNDIPIAMDDSLTLNEDARVKIHVRENDIDIEDGDTLDIKIITAPQHGTTTTPGDSIRYRPTTDYFGLDSLEYTACDSQNACDTAWLFLEIESRPESPEAVQDNRSTVEDTTNYPIQFLINDSDSDSDFNFSSVGDAVSGASITIQGDSIINYTPVPNYYGVDTIIYTICDPTGLCDNGIIRINVHPRPDKPDAVDDFVTTNTKEDSSSIIIITNDTNIDGDALIAELITQPTKGTATLDGDTLIFRPEYAYGGLDSLTYRICNTSMLCDTATVHINIAFINDAPVVDDDILVITDTACINIDVASNASDLNNDTLVITVVDGQNSNIQTNPDGSFEYCPSNNYSISDTIYFAVCDTHAMALCDTAQFIIQMTCPTFSHNLVHDAECPNQPFSVTGVDVKDLTIYEWTYPDLLGNEIMDTTLTGIRIPSSGPVVLKSSRFGCAPVLDTLMVTVRAPLTVASLDNTVLECEGEQVVLEIDNPELGLTYQWYKEGNTTPLAQGIYYTVNQLNTSTSGKYFIRSTDNICTSTPSNLLDLQFITDFTVPLIEAGPDITTCEDGASLNALSAVAEWRTNGSSFISDINDPNARVFDLEIGENKYYWVQENKSCIETSIDSVFVFYYPAPELVRDSFFVELNQTTNLNLLINDQLYGLNSNIKVITPPNGVIDLGNGTIEVLVDGEIESPLDFEYQVCFDVCPDNCVNAIVNVHYELPDVCEVPNVITPNGDGINDFLVIDCINAYQESQLIIFNRWGDEIYSNDQYDNTWNGTIDGEQLPVGTYFYIFTINDADNTVEKGFIHIDR